MEKAGQQILQPKTEQRKTLRTLANKDRQS